MQTNESLKRKQEQRTQRKNNLDLSAMVYGKIPPQAKELEAAVLGACMLERSAFSIAIEILTPECFYVNAHQTIFSRMCDLNNAGIPIDSLTVVESLHKAGQLESVGGPYFVSELTRPVTSSANLEAHARIVLQKFLQRELIRVSGEIINTAYEDNEDVFDMMEKAETDIMAISARVQGKAYKHISTVAMQALKKLDEIRNRKTKLTGVDTGHSQLNNVTCGWQPSDLIIIAARPSVGKTAFALNLAKAAATSSHKKTGVAVFQLEMNDTQLVNRMLSEDSRIPLTKLTHGRATQEDIDLLTGKTLPMMFESRIFLDDTAALSLLELGGKLRKLVAKEGIGLAIIDYLQLMTVDHKGGGNREQEISKISRGLKKLAKELHIPIIALSQMSRDVEKRKGQPQLSDLRESGAIEQDADFVGFLYKPSKEDEEKDPRLKNTGQLIIKKHRNGALEDVDYRVYNEIQAWMTISEGLKYDTEQSEFMKGSPNKEDKGFSLEDIPSTLTDGAEDLPF